MARAFLAGGARLLQVRGQGRWPAGDLLDLVDAVAGAGAPAGATVIVNDRADIAGWPPRTACTSDRTTCRRPWPGACSAPAALVGCSTHTAAQIDERAQRRR